MVRLDEGATATGIPTEDWPPLKGVSLGEVSSRGRLVWCLRVWKGRVRRFAECNGGMKHTVVRHDHPRQEWEIGEFGADGGKADSEARGWQKDLNVGDLKTRGFASQHVLPLKHFTLSRFEMAVRWCSSARLYAHEGKMLPAQSLGYLGGPNDPGRIDKMRPLTSEAPSHVKMAALVSSRLKRVPGEATRP